MLGRLFVRVLRSPRNSPLVITRTHRTERIIYASHLEYPNTVFFIVYPAYPVYATHYLCAFVRHVFSLCIVLTTCEPSGFSVEQTSVCVGPLHSTLLHRVRATFLPMNEYAVVLLTMSRISCRVISFSFF